MPEQKTLERMRRDKREGKAATTQAGEFVREEFHHIREGKHGARSPRQAIAIGLSKARRAGVKLPPSSDGKFSGKARRQAEREYERGRHGGGRVSARRSRITSSILKREDQAVGSTRAISEQAHRAAQRRSPSSRSRAAKKAARTRASHH
ncbi:MAG: DUF6496 domain-containing protein [Limisphaerales bacterium]